MGGNGKYFRKTVGNAGAVIKFVTQNREPIKNIRIFESESRRFNKTLCCAWMAPTSNRGFLHLEPMMEEPDVNTEQIDECCIFTLVLKIIGSSTLELC